MNKEQGADYYKGVFFVAIIFIAGILLNKATEFMLLVLSLAAMRFVALSRNDAKGRLNETEDKK